MWMPKRFTETTVGVGATYVNSSAVDRAAGPAGVTTVTSATPAPAGLTAVIVVAFTTTTPVAAVEPKSTAVAPVNPVPVIVTVVPPADGPLSGLTPVTVGAAATTVAV